MIQVGPQTLVLLCVDAVDFRKGIESLMALCRDQLEKNPFSGTVFVFRNRKKTSIRLLFYDGQGYWICTKRFSEGKIKWWPHVGEKISTVDARSLQVLLWNGNPTESEFSKDWKPLPKVS